MAKKKPDFPSRPCPKCGAPIHIKTKKHEKCGWSMNGQPAKSANGEVNKSAAVRELIKTNPKTPVNEVVAALAAQGIKVSTAFVYTIKSKAKAKRRRQKRQKAIAASNGAGAANPVRLVLDVRKLAVDAGGIRHLKQLVDILAE